jgi:bacteriocin biosynthesis cyclodehydratase domain-containing protein
MEQVITALRPKLKHNWVFIQTADGLLVKGEEKDFYLKGKSIARWVFALKPYLTGEYTLEQLCKKLAPAQREHMQQILTHLWQKGVVINLLPEAPEDLLPSEILQQFRAQIEYLAHYIDYPQKQFRQWRESSLLLHGSGESLTALALFCLRNGLKRITLSPVDSARPVGTLTSLEREATELRQAGCPVDIEVLAHPFTSPDFSLAGYDLVVYCSNQGSLKDIYALQARCWQAGKAFLAATPLGREMMLGPLALGKASKARVADAEGEVRETPCWLCALLRYAAHSETEIQALLWRGLALGGETLEMPLFPAVARRVGQGLGFELFKTLTGAARSELEHGVNLHNVETLESEFSRVEQHPLCPLCSQVVPDDARDQLEAVLAGSRDHEYSDDELYEKCLDLLNPHTGLFTAFQDEELEQLPLKTSRLVGYAPTSLRESLAKQVFVLDTPHQARLLALKQSTSRYVGYLPDARSLLCATPQALRAEGKIPVLPQEFATWSGTQAPGPDESMAWLPAYALLRQSQVYVPAAGVYTHAWPNRDGVFERTWAGTATETSFERLIQVGLSSALTYEYRKHLLHQRCQLKTLDLSELVPEDVDLTFLGRCVTRLARTFALHKVDATLPLHAVLAQTNDTDGPELATLGLGLSLPEAARAALNNLVGGLQALEEKKTGLAESDEGFVPFAVLPKQSSVADQAGRDLSEEVQTWTQAQEQLQKQGYDLIFVHTTSSDLWQKQVLLSGTVLLQRLEM